MLNHKQSRPFQSREEFLTFVRDVSPQADVTSVLLFGQFHRAHHQLEQAAEKHLESVGLSWSKFRLLMHLMHCEKMNHGGMQPSELSERQDISRNTVSALISSLEKDGLISRALHGEDRRRPDGNHPPARRPHRENHSRGHQVASCSRRPVSPALPDCPRWRPVPGVNRRRA